MGKTSNVWMHVKRINDNTAKCNLCDETVSAKGGNTSTIKRHLISIHKIDVDKMETSSPSIKGFLTPTKTTLTMVRSAEIDRRIAAFIARDCRPISTVDGEGFCELINFMEPDYTVKSRATTTTQIKRMYDNGVTKLKDLLSQAEHVAFTTDLWTSVQNIAYMCVTAHYITRDWQAGSCVQQSWKHGKCAENTLGRI